jgi:hypothetical protein
MVDYHHLLKLALEEAKKGLSEGGVPVGAILADQEGNVLKATLPFTARRRPSRTPAGSADTKTKFWSPPFPLAGIAAG